VPHLKLEFAESNPRPLFRSDCILVVIGVYDSR
jgi:hypothetical protein